MRLQNKQLIDKKELSMFNRNDKDEMVQYVIGHTKHKMVDELIEHIPWNMVDKDNGVIETSYDIELMDRNTLIVFVKNMMKLIGAIIEIDNKQNKN